ncbi:SDR family oxidoreductase [Paraburkholderia sp. BL10I2N1]|uniref:SDR family oxidoreductase n=1 Tax=Paraburkholderia sp. BL10I2N1 TaxID=1938796 RepID=UPI00105FE220|nr:SDR family oxidoreductase [Paraburkholderia sp. BL10I2N1]TDN70018.1 uncharacterized protein YbjT (DUF2867 family) [Paraburkholderia sp. BL10I2N1]
MSRTILVTGATSAISAEVIKGLVAANAKVRALVRNPEKGDSLARSGIDIVVGDLEKPQTLDAVFAGVDTAFMLTPPGPRAPEQGSNALWAARQAGVRRIVRLSAFGAAHNAPTINGRLHALSDAELIASGLSYTILKPHFFMQNLLMAARSVAEQGILPLPMGNGRMGMIDTRDIASFAARVLMSDGHANVSYTLTGPASISMDETACALASVLAKPVRYQDVPLDAALRNMAEMGFDDFTLNVLHDYFVAYSGNWGDVVTDDILRVTGAPARTVAEFARDFADAFGGVRVG